YDENGNMIEDASAKSLKYNWDNKLRYAKSGSSVLLALKYDPSGNRIYKETNNGAVKRKYIVDIVGDLPVILMEINPTNSSIVKTYIYANGEILAQHNGGYRYFFLHDRLGSVRQVISTTGSNIAYLTYNPFGGTLEIFAPSTVAPFRFAGQYYDTEISQYYLRARQYDPYISRFTSRDPADGKFEEPLTLHKYLYCTNDPINFVDPQGFWTFHLTGTGVASLLGLPRVSRQSGIVIDDKGNWGWMNNTGIGGGLPSVSLGLTLGFTTADSIKDLKEWSGSIGGGYTMPLGGLSGDVVFGQDWWGFQLTYNPPLTSWSLIPLDMHGEADYCEIYTWQYIKDRFRDIAETGMSNAKTLGEAYQYSIIWGFASE
ncbi:MAG: RHS repeat-associated core domain-containing protein, partial [Sedimentisphaerales bacterium]